MYKKIFLLTVLLLGSIPLHAGMIVRKGKFIERNQYATFPQEEHYQIAMEAYEAENYPLALHHFSIVSHCFEGSPLVAWAHYYAALTYFGLEEYDYANHEFTEYLHTTTDPHHFMDALEYKFAIAEAFRSGACRRVFAQHTLPKWVKDKELAVEIYDEIIAALPNHDLTVMSLYFRGILLEELHDFREAVESFQTLIRRFPRSEYAPESHRQAIKVFKTQAEWEFQNPDLITLAEMQLEKFRAQFPKDDRLEEAACDIQEIKENYARGLLEMGSFYERRQKASASVLYYQQAIELFPETQIAMQCQQRLQLLGYGDEPPPRRPLRTAPFSPRPKLG